ASRADAARLSAGIVRVVISRFTDTRPPTAPRLKALTPASTTITSAEARKILELSRMPARLRASRNHRPTRAYGAIDRRQERPDRGFHETRPVPSTARIRSKPD